MALLTKRKFSFVSKAADADSFAVVNFTGFEALSSPYRLEIVLISEDKELDPLQVLQNTAVFTIHRDNEEDVAFNGILMQFEETQEFNGYLFYKAVLMPKLQWLSLTSHNQVFLEQPIPDTLQAVLKEGGLVDGIDFEFKLQNTYRPLEYVCQYDETHLNFISRWTEREGIYYFFEQTDQGEKVIFTDTELSHTDLSQGKDLTYNPQSGLDSLHTEEAIKAFLCRHSMLPQQVFLKDYNYRKPLLAMEGKAEVDPDGRGETYVYGEHFSTPEEGNRLAEIRAEEFLCRKSIYYGNSSVPFMDPGFSFTLHDHYKKAYNKKYLLTEVGHEGHQTGYLVSGLSGAVAPVDEPMFYANTFTVIPADVQFRPERTATKPKISGTFNAKVDAAASGQYAELDDQGRYKVILPFDRSGRGIGKASAWCRMMQPYAGAGYGMHFPLHKGIEVLLTFIAGDPDRPIIAGAVPNPETATPVKGGNQTQSMIRTGGGNQIRIEDGEGGQQIHMSSPTSNSIISLGDVNKGNIFLKSDGTWVSEIGANNTTTIGGDSKLEITGDDEQTIGVNQGIHVTGDRTLIVEGKEKKEVRGDDWCQIKGAKSSMTIGATHEISVAAKSTQSLAATQELFVGVKATQNLSAVSDFTAGVKHGTFAGLNYEHNYGWKIDKSDVKDLHIGPDILKQATKTIVLQCGNSLIQMTPSSIVIDTDTLILFGNKKTLISTDGKVIINGEAECKKDVKMNKELKVKGTATDKNSDR